MQPLLWNNFSKFLFSILATRSFLNSWASLGSSKTSHQNHNPRSRSNRTWNCSCLPHQNLLDIQWSNQQLDKSFYACNPYSEQFLWYFAHGNFTGICIVQFAFANLVQDKTQLYFLSLHAISREAIQTVLRGYFKPWLMNKKLRLNDYKRKKIRVNVRNAWWKIIDPIQYFVWRNSLSSIMRFRTQQNRRVSSSWRIRYQSNWELACKSLISISSSFLPERMKESMLASTYEQNLKRDGSIRRYQVTLSRIIFNTWRPGLEIWRTQETQIKSSNQLLKAICPKAIPFLIKLESILFLYFSRSNFLDLQQHHSLLWMRAVSAKHNSFLSTCPSLLKLHTDLLTHTTFLILINLIRSFHIDKHQIHRFLQPSPFSHRLPVPIFSLLPLL